MTVIDEMVNRFLSWPVPKDFMPDGGITFKPINHPSSWPVGTNLFTADQAKLMLEHIAGPALAAKQAEIDRLMLEYCPGEMTAGQVAEWGKNQIAAPSAASSAVPAKELFETLEWLDGGSDLRYRQAARLMRALMFAPPAERTNTPGEPNRDVSAGSSHAQPDGPATKPATASSQAGASQGSAPISMKLPVKMTDDGESPLWHDADGKYISYEEITELLNSSVSSARSNAPGDAAREIERAQLHGPDLRTLNALEDTLARAEAAERDFLQVHKNCIAARDRVAELERASHATSTFCRACDGVEGAAHEGPHGVECRLCEPGIGHNATAAQYEASVAMDALRGLYGLLQLYAARPDCPPWLSVWTESHRAVEAKRVIDASATRGSDG